MSGSLFNSLSNDKLCKSKSKAAGGNIPFYVEVGRVEFNRK